MSNFRQVNAFLRASLLIIILAVLGTCFAHSRRIRQAGPETTVSNPTLNDRIAALFPKYELPKRREFFFMFHSSAAVDADNCQYHNPETFVRHNRELVGRLRSMSQELSVIITGQERYFSQFRELESKLPGYAYPRVPYYLTTRGQLNDLARLVFLQARFDFADRNELEFFKSVNLFLQLQKCGVHLQPSNIKLLHILSSSYTFYPRPQSWMNETLSLIKALPIRESSTTEVDLFNKRQAIASRNCAYFAAMAVRDHKTSGTYRLPKEAYAKEWLDPFTDKPVRYEIFEGGIKFYCTVDKSSERVPQVMKSIALFPIHFWAKFNESPERRLKRNP